MPEPIYLKTREAAATARARAYDDAAAMVRRWSRGYSTRLQFDMEMLAKQMEAKGADGAA